MDNQAITYLMIDTDSGFAPPRWQSGIGTVIIARKDKKPLLPVHYEGFWIYTDLVLEHFGDGGKPGHMYSRAAFEEWWTDYVDEQKENGRAGSDKEDDIEGWKNPRSPYAV